MTRSPRRWHPARWLLPLALVGGHAALWPAMPAVLVTDPPTGTQTAVALLLTAAAGLALCWRQVAPVPVLLVTALISAAGLWWFPDGEAFMAAVIGYVALYNVAVLRPARQAVIATAALAAGDCVTTVLIEGTDRPGDLVIAIVISVVSVTLVLALGRNRRRWRAERAAAADRLARAQARGRQAADAERHRLARELHDVTAHHLTSIVVTASAAQRLAGSRPELLADALSFAARTGRETLAALHRLVAVMQTPDEEPAPPAEALEELADGFRLLGQVVSVDAAPGPLPPGHADAVHGIAREALTNTLRYAPGSTVRLHLARTGTGTELVVDDDGRRTPGASAGLGSGRGVTGMSERATTLGGALTAGPRPGGGWQVRAVLPSAPAHRPVGTHPWTRIRSAPAADVVLMLFTLLLPVGALVAEQQDSAAVRDPARLSVLVVLLIAHALPLLWRRRHPWSVLAATAATTLGWPVAVHLRSVTVDDAYLLAFAVVVDLIAVWAVAVYGRMPAVTWLSAPATAGSTALAVALVMTFERGDPLHRAEPDAVVFATIGMTVLLGMLLLVPALSVWGAGAAVRRRRTRLRSGEDTALAIATYQAVESARAERSRVAVGLRDAVLHRTSAVAAAADHGDIDAVLLEARAALAAMRGLLSGMREAPTAGQAVAPQPTAAGIGALCERHPAVRYDVTGVPRSLPADIDVSAYRVVELLVTASRPAAVHLYYAPDAIRLTVTGSTPAADGATAAGLRARIAAVGGTITVEPSGMIDVRLPAPAPAATEEVAPSPSV